MATFQAQIEATTNVAFDTNPAPTTAQLTQFLTDGAKEVISRISIGSPEKLPLFSVSATVSNDNGLATQNGLVISVLRADGTSADNLEPCSRISSDLRYRVTDTESLDYRSVFNPAYYILDGKVYIVPEPTNSTTNKGVINSVGYPVVAYNESSIVEFPNEYEYLVVLYATMKTFESIMAFYANDEEDIELVQAIQPNLIMAQQVYDKQFALMMPPQEEREEAR